MKKGVVVGLLVVIVFFLSLFIVGALETNNILLKVSLKQGDQTSRVVSVATDKGGEFNIDSYDLPGVFIKDTEFVLNSNEKKQVEVVFDSKFLEPGVYVGRISISGGGDVSNIPIIFEVEAKDVFFDVNVDIPPEYNEVEPGGRLLAQVKIFDLTSGGTSEGLGATNVDTEYYLFDLEGNVLSSESEGLVVERQARITKTLTLPSDIKQGDYVFVAVVKSGNSFGVSTQLFSVVVSKKGVFNFGGGYDVNLLLMLGFFAVIFIVVIFLFIYLVRDRDKVLLELRRYNSSELRNQRQMLIAQQKYLSRKRGVNNSEVKREIKEKVVVLKKKQKKRVEEFKKLKKEGNEKEMLRKLDRWKSEGYNTVGIESKLKGLNVGEMKDIMKGWKKEGYNIGKKGKGSQKKEKSSGKKR